MMKHFVLIAVLGLGSLGMAQGQTTAAPAASAPAATQAPAPLPDETTLKINDTGADGQPSPAPSADVTVWDFLKMFLILALVLGMILGFVWFLRKLSGQDPAGAANQPIKVLHTQNIGGSRVLQVVELADQVLLLGSGEGGLRLLKDLTGTEAADTFRLAATQAKPASPAGFADLVGSFLGAKPKIRPDVGQPVDNSSDFLKKQRERLKNL